MRLAITAILSILLAGPSTAQVVLDTDFIPPEHLPKLTRALTWASQNYAPNAEVLVMFVNLHPDLLADTTSPPYSAYRIHFGPSLLANEEGNIRSVFAHEFTHIALLESGIGAGGCDQLYHELYASFVEIEARRETGATAGYIHRTRRYYKNDWKESQNFCPWLTRVFPRPR